MKIIYIITIIIVLILFLYLRKSNKSNKLIRNHHKVIIEKNKDTEELVIAMCNEDIKWVKKYVEKYKLITIYNKCKKIIPFEHPKIRIIETPNIGSCDYAFLSYIIERYDNLPHYVEFTKGWIKPTNKYYNCLSCKGNSSMYDKLMNFTIKDHKFGYKFNKTNDNLEWHPSGYKNIGEWIEYNDFLNKELYKRNYCNIIFGGNFGTTSEQIRRTPKKVWEAIRSMQKYPREEVDHFIERTWGPLLCKPKYKLVIVAIFKNEKVAIREWIEHYIREGVEHFYMIDNGSTDDWSSEIRDIPNDILTIYTDKEKYKQNDHYNNYFLEEVKQNAEWVMVVDLDEFMYARNYNNKITDVLESTPNDIGEIQVRWKMFGSNGHIIQPDSIIKGFIKRNIIDDTKEFNHCKSICRTIFLESLGIHNNKISPNTKIICYPEDSDEQLLMDSPLHLNHYTIQSKEWFSNVKMTRGAADTSSSEHVRNEEYFQKYDCNDMFDTELYEKTYHYSHIFENNTHIKRMR